MAGSTTGVYELSLIMCLGANTFIEVYGLSMVDETCICIMWEDNYENDEYAVNDQLYKL